MNRGRTSRLILAVIFVLVAAIGTPTSPVAAAPEATSTVSGTVVAGNTAVPSVRVEAWRNGSMVKAATTTSTGRFTLSGLAAGSYVLVADSVTIVRTEQPVNVPSGSTVSGVRISVIKSGKVQGAVKSGGAAVGAATVELFASPSAATPLATTTSTSAGQYRFVDIAPGAVYVRARKAGLTGWFGGSTPAVVNVLAGKTIFGRNVTLAPAAGHTISGFLSTSVGVGANGSVKVYEAFGAQQFVGAYPTVNGNWSTGQLPAGSYLVLFTAPGETSEWWPDIDFMDRATPVVLSTGSVVLNAQLDARSMIDGRGLLPSGLPAPSNSYAVIYIAGTSQVVGIDVVDAQGRFEIGGIRTGRSYDVEVRPPSGSTLTPSLRRQVGVGGSGDHVLRPPAGSAYLFGNLSTSAGMPANGSVKLYRTGAPATFIGSYVTANGTWVTDPVTPGSYQVMFTAPGETGEWWYQGDSIDQATPVAVGANPVGPLDASLLARSLVIANVRTPSGGEAPSNSLVVAYMPGTNQVVGVGATAPNGQAQVGGLRVGRWYEMEARPPSGSVMGNSPRQLVYLPCCGTATNLRLTSPPGHGALEVYVSGGRSALVQLWRATAVGPVLSQGVQAAPNSFARFEAVPDGTYLVKFTSVPGLSPIADEWWGNVGDPNEATRLTFTSSSRLYSLSQTVGETDGWIYAYVGPPWYSGVLGTMQVFDASGAVVSTVTLNGSGAPSHWLAPGQYRVLFTPADGSGLASEWYDNAAGFGTASVVNVTPGVASIVRWHLDPAPGARLASEPSDPSQPLRPPDAA